MTQAEETTEAIQQRIDELNSQFETEATALLEGASPDSVPIEEISIAPKKTDISVVDLAVCWTPWKVDAAGNAQQAW